MLNWNVDVDAWSILYHSMDFYKKIHCAERIQKNATHTIKEDSFNSVQQTFMGCFMACFFYLVYCEAWGGATNLLFRTNEGQFYNGVSRYIFRAG